jgi:hypothetical protein
MSKRGTMAGLIAVLLLFAGKAQAEENEPPALIEFGGAGELNLQDRRSSFGPNLAVEFTPIENWLEIEAGVTPLFGHGHTRWGTDLLFKKPFTLSDKVEFMVGVGPEWVHTTGGGKSTDSLTGEAVLDFIIWPSRERKFGWYVEPSYGFDFGRGHEQSLGATVGLVIPIP